jgi:hypothetical protein
VATYEHSATGLGPESIAFFEPTKGRSTRTHTHTHTDTHTTTCTYTYIHSHSHSDTHTRSQRALCGERWEVHTETRDGRVIVYPASGHREGEVSRVGLGYLPGTHTQTETHART